MQIKLSDGTQVTLKPDWTHAIQKAFNLALFQDGQTVTAKSLFQAWEVAFSTVIEKIEKNGFAVEYNASWLDSLRERDYKKLQKAADSLDADAESAGEKNLQKL